MNERVFVCSRARVCVCACACLSVCLRKLACVCVCYIACSERARVHAGANVCGCGCQELACVCAQVYARVCGFGSPCARVLASMGLLSIREGKIERSDRDRDCDSTGALANIV